MLTFLKANLLVMWTFSKTMSWSVCLLSWFLWETTLNASRFVQSSQLASQFTSLDHLDLPVSEVCSNLHELELQFSKVGSYLQGV